MSKTLSTILTIFKVARILAKIVFILCIVGGAGCVLGLISLPLVGGLMSVGIFSAEEGLSLPSAYLGCIVGIIACAGEAVFAFLAERYFQNVLKAETPFTFDGAKESFRLGLVSIIISVAISVASGIVAFVFLLFASSFVEPEIDMSFSLSTGLFFLFLSLIFKYGAELQKPCEEKAKQEEQTSETESL